MLREIHQKRSPKVMVTETGDQREAIKKLPWFQGDNKLAATVKLAIMSVISNRIFIHRCFLKHFRLSTENLDKFPW